MTAPLHDPIHVEINGVAQELNVDPEMPILWVLRDVLGLTGTKYGCGQALCGACSVHLDGQVVRSCCTPVARAAGKSLTTIEGLSKDGTHPLQQAWIELAVPQCGFCQAGQIMSAAALLRKQPNPSDEQIEQSLAGNLCRCGTYTRIRAAVKRAAELAAKG
jgi:isoquinoline 1-oxidoreductase alpha subunit